MPMLGAIDKFGRRRQLCDLYLMRIAACKKVNNEVSRRPLFGCFLHYNEQIDARFGGARCINL